MKNRFSFVGGDTGEWQVKKMLTLSGESLAPVLRLRVVNDAMAVIPKDGVWLLQGFTSNIRYAERQEITALKSIQPDLNRPEAVHAVLIPLKKSAQWWDLPQNERRAIFEEQSHHTAIGLDYLPAIARRLHHSRDLGEPFDFLTWFEFAPEHTDAFDDLLVRLRASKEWTYVEREVEIRLEKAINPILSPDVNSKHGR